VDVAIVTVLLASVNKYRSVFLDDDDGGSIGIQKSFVDIILTLDSRGN
jgi:hypothetical protein